MSYAKFHESHGLASIARALRDQQATEKSLRDVPGCLPTPTGETAQVGTKTDKPGSETHPGGTSSSRVEVEDGVVAPLASAAPPKDLKNKMKKRKVVEEGHENTELRRRKRDAAPGGPSMEMVERSSLKEGLDGAPSSSSSSPLPPEVQLLMGLTHSYQSDLLTLQGALHASGLKGEQLLMRVLKTTMASFNRVDLQLMFPTSSACPGKE